MTSQDTLITTTPGPENDRVIREVDLSQFESGYPKRVAEPLPNFDPYHRITCIGSITVGELVVAHRVIIRPDGVEEPINGHLFMGRVKTIDRSPKHRHIVIAQPPRPDGSIGADAVLPLDEILDGDHELKKNFGSRAVKYAFYPLFAVRSKIPPEQLKPYLPKEQAA